MSNINAKYRTNENSYNYWFAFLSVKFLDTSYGREMYTKMIEKEETVIMTYDKEEGKYWEISIRSQDRGLNKKPKQPPTSPTPTSSVVVVEEEGEIYEEKEEEITTTNFTFYDHVDIYKDYLELERDIFGNNVFENDEYPYPKWGPFVPLRALV